MQRTFEDCYWHASETGGAGIGFWLALLRDEGRSIVREHAAAPHGQKRLDNLLFALVVIWVFAVMIVPTAPALKDWRNLVVPTGVLALLLLAVPGIHGIARRFVTVVVALAAVECVATVAQSLHHQSDLLAPFLLVVCMAFSIKTLARLNARIMGIEDSVRGREELAYGGLVGLAGVVGFAIAADTPNDDNLLVPFLFHIAVPFLCGVVGFKTSRRYLSVCSGIYAALGSMLIGAAIWILTEPLVVEGASLAGLLHTTVFVAWQSGLSIVLFTSAVIGMVGALFGDITREDWAARQTAP